MRVRILVAVAAVSLAVLVGGASWSFDGSGAASEVVNLEESGPEARAKQRSVKFYGAMW
ncbi:MAG: hypothetical protein QF464_03845 [Myxococcota bacterium]|jgi:hypothetical protein|nr:hypothetical protein [Myxococcota bacterium]